MSKYVLARYRIKTTGQEIAFGKEWSYGQLISVLNCLMLDASAKHRWDIELINIKVFDNELPTASTIQEKLADMPIKKLQEIQRTLNNY